MGAPSFSGRGGGGKESAVCFQPIQPAGGGGGGGDEYMVGGGGGGGCFYANDILLCKFN